MKSAILYATTKKPRRLDYLLITKGWQGGACRIWVRTVIVSADIATALNVAKPRPGECVLNTIPLP